MNWFNKPAKKQKTFEQNRKKATPQEQTFILEPILTPSGLVDGVDDTPEEAIADWETNSFLDVNIADSDEDIDSSLDAIDADGLVEAIADSTADADVTDEDVQFVEFFSTEIDTTAEANEPTADLSVDDSTLSERPESGTDEPVKDTVDNTNSAELADEETEVSSVNIKDETTDSLSEAETDDTAEIKVANERTESNDEELKINQAQEDESDRLAGGDEDLEKTVSVDEGEAVNLDETAEPAESSDKREFDKNTSEIIVSGDKTTDNQTKPDPNKVLDTSPLEFVSGVFTVDKNEETPSENSEVTVAETVAKDEVIVIEAVVVKDEVIPSENSEVTVAETVAKDEVIVIEAVVVKDEVIPSENSEVTVAETVAEEETILPKTDSDAAVAEVVKDEETPSENSEVTVAETATAKVEEHLKEIQAQVQAIQEARKEAQNSLQNFLGTSGNLLPSRERLSAVEKQIQTLTAQIGKLEETMQLLLVQMATNPSESWQSQMEMAASYLTTLKEELEWALVQQDFLNSSIPDSPQRLAIADLIGKLKQRLEEELNTHSLPLQRWIDFLQEVEASGANFLEGFDNLNSRLDKVTVEKTHAAQTLARVKQEYQTLGLAKAELESKIAKTEELIQKKDEEIAGIEEAIARVSAIQVTLPIELEDAQWQKVIDEQISVTSDLLNTRQTAAEERLKLVPLQSTLSEVNTQLQAVQTERQELQASPDNAVESLQIKNMQLQAEQLQLQNWKELYENLRIAESDAYYEARDRQRNTWYWTGKEYVYNPNEAAAYRLKLQETSFIADQRNKLWEKQQLGQQSLAELNKSITEQQQQINQQQSQLATLVAQIAGLQSQANNLQAQIAPIANSLAPVLAQEKAQTQKFLETMAQGQSKAS